MKGSINNNEFSNYATQSTIQNSAGNKNLTLPVIQRSHSVRVLSAKPSLNNPSLVSPGEFLMNNWSSKRYDTNKIYPTMQT